MAERGRSAEELVPGAERLPAGRHGLPREVVAENQRERLLNGVVDAVAEHGYNATTIGAITEAAKISRRTFYEHFKDKEGCFLAAYEMIDTHVRGAMLTAAERPAPWPERVRASLAALLEVLSGDLAVARFYLLEQSDWGYVVLDQDTGEVEVRDQVLMGGITTLIARQLKAGEAATLPELLPDLTELALAPHLGRSEARRLARESRSRA